MSTGPTQEIPGTTAAGKLRKFLLSRGLPDGTEPLTPDASARKYFRIAWHDGSAVACVYPEAFGNDLPSLDTTGLFEAAGVPVAEIYDTDKAAGIVIQQDLGDTSLAGYLATASGAERERLVGDAVRLIAKIQAATDLARERRSIAHRLRFDREKLEWELGFFLDHHFGSLLKRPLAAPLEKAVRIEFASLAEDLEEYSKYLTHRDFHASNLMLAASDRLFLIDHQDARLGSAAYDIVSLLLDRITEPPPHEWLSRKRGLLLSERERLGLEIIEAREFALEFDLVAIQRCLKAIGTFSNQAGNFRRSNYLPYIAPMFGIVKETCKRLERYPAIVKMIGFSEYRRNR